MKKFLAAAVILALTFANTSYAQKSGSSSSSSRSSSSSSSSRSSSPSSSPRSSSGSSSSSKPSYSSPRGNSYSAPKPSAPAPKPPAPAAKSPSGNSYSAGKPSAPVTKPADPKPSAVAKSPSGNSYSSGTKSTEKPADTNKTAAIFNPGQTAAAQKQESKAKYDASKPPVFKTPSGATKTVSPQTAKVVEKQITRERYVTYENRSSSFYGNHYAPVRYEDHFSPFLMGYLLSSTVNAADRAAWAYNHRSEMDDARYRAMLAKDAELSARVAAMERAGTPRDPGYVLPTMADNPDIQYDADFVKSAYRPTSDGIGWTGFFGLILMTMAGAAVAIYIVHNFDKWVTA